MAEARLTEESAEVVSCSAAVQVPGKVDEGGVVLGGDMGFGGWVLDEKTQVEVVGGSLLPRVPSHPLSLQRRLCFHEAASR